MSANGANSRQPPLHPYISACGVDKKQSKMAASFALWSG